eukprot:scaffold39149_cov93-Skeletonema_marinoi.AAC.9
MIFRGATCRCVSIYTTSCLLPHYTSNLHFIQGSPDGMASGTAGEGKVSSTRSPCRTQHHLSIVQP